MSKLNDYRQQFDGLPIRTRIILTFATILLLFLVFHLAWYAQADNKASRNASRIDNLEQQITLLNNTQQQINQGVYDRRNNPKFKRVAKLQADIEAVQQQLEEKTLSLVRPEAMAGLIKDIIDNSGSLKLISLAKQPPIAIKPQQEDELELNKPDNQSETNIEVYRHPVVMVFEGSFTDTQRFLAELEKMQRRVNFERFEFSVEEYPKSQVTLEVSTISLTRKWIGG